MHTKLEPTKGEVCFLGMDVIFDEFGYKMTSNTLGMQVDLDMPKSYDEADDKECKDSMSDGIKKEESHEAIGDHE
jgi:hypothetical protein